MNDPEHQCQACSQTWIGLGTECPFCGALPLTHVVGPLSPPQMRVIVTMTSEEFGTDEFQYDSLQDAVDGMARLVREIVRRNDGVVRQFTVEELRDIDD